MDESRLHRRQFNKLTAAALGGMMSGALAGCNFSSEPADDAAAESSGPKHLCRGLNDCKGQGADGKNDCRGMGTCATYAHHACGGQNACKNQGGCGDEVGSNECKGDGGCEIPLMESAWEEMRTRLEADWKEAGKEFQDSPAKPAA